MSKKMKPNIVLIVMDTARAKNFSCYGYERETTPFIDELAEDGKLYERCISQAPWTFPSHASLFSGKYPHEVGVLGAGDNFDVENSMASVLKSKGYRTIGISNNAWISPDFGMDQGFDEFININKDVIFKEDSLWKEMIKDEHDDRWDSKLEKYVEFIYKGVRQQKPRQLANGVYYLLKEKLFSGLFDRLFLEDTGAKETNKLVRQRIKEFSEEPFFLFLNYVEPHGPYRPPRKFAKKFCDASLREMDDAADLDKLEVWSGRDIPGSRETEIMESLYDAEINYLDYRIKKLYDYLRSEKLIDNTVFIVTSDHGEFFGEHGAYGHGLELYQEVVHVPLVVRDHRKDPVYISEPEKPLELKSLYYYVLSLVGAAKLDTGPRETLSTVYGGLESHEFNPFSEYPELQESRYIEPKIGAISSDAKLVETPQREEIRAISNDFRNDEKELSRDFDLYEELSYDILDISPASLQEGRIHEQVRDQEVKDRLRELGYNQ